MSNIRAKSAGEHPREVDRSGMGCSKGTRWTVLYLGLSGLLVLGGLAVFSGFEGSAAGGIGRLVALSKAALPSGFGWQREKQYQTREDGLPPLLLSDLSQVQLRATSLEEVKARLNLKPTELSRLAATLPLNSPKSRVIELLGASPDHVVLPEDLVHGTLEQPFFPAYALAWDNIPCARVLGFFDQDDILLRLHAGLRCEPELVAQSQPPPWMSCRETDRATFCAP